MEGAIEGEGRVGGFGFGYVTDAEDEVVWLGRLREELFDDLEALCVFTINVNGRRGTVGTDSRAVNRRLPGQTKPQWLRSFLWWPPYFFERFISRCKGERLLFSSVFSPKPEPEPEPEGGSWSSQPRPEMQCNPSPPRRRMSI